MNLHWTFYLLTGIIGIAMMIGPAILFDAFERWEHEDYHEKDDEAIGW